MNINYQPASNRYDDMKYSRCGVSSLRLPRISLGLWHNFGTDCNFRTATDIITRAFDRGVTHFDLANNYGPVPGSAEENFGDIFRNELSAYRDEIIVASKAGHEMWEGPYGGNSSRKSVMASIDQSLRRTGLDYFDIFYSHRYDGETPVEETMSALVDIVRAGKALYVGLSKYPPQQAREAYEYLRSKGVGCLMSQYRYSMFERGVEAESLPLATEHGSGFVAFSPLAQGLLTDKYLGGIPSGSRAASESRFLSAEQITKQKLEIITELNNIAIGRGETLAQMALAWVLRDERVTSVIVGASSVAQLDDSLGALNSQGFDYTLLEVIDKILAKG
ncbi:MAG: aldo/keto reductase [Rikenellaceae bacterium]